MKRSRNRKPASPCASVRASAHRASAARPFAGVEALERRQLLSVAVANLTVTPAAVSSVGDRVTFVASGITESDPAAKLRRVKFFADIDSNPATTADDILLGSARIKADGTATLNIPRTNPARFPSGVYEILAVAADSARATGTASAPITVTDLALLGAVRRAHKSPEAKVRFIETGVVVGYNVGQDITIQVNTGHGDGRRETYAIGQGIWPHLGSVFFEGIFQPPPGYEKDFPVHTPIKPETVAPGQHIWFALEGLSIHSLQLYQVAIQIPTATPAEFNAVVRNSVELRRSRNQTEIARDYQCRLIESPAGSGLYPDNPTLLEQDVPADSIFADRLDITGPPPKAPWVWARAEVFGCVYEWGWGARDDGERLHAAASVSAAADLRRIRPPAGTEEGH